MAVRLSTPFSPLPLVFTWIRESVENAASVAATGAADDEDGAAARGGDHQHFQVGHALRLHDAGFPTGVLSQSGGGHEEHTPQSRDEGAD